MEHGEPLGLLSGIDAAAAVEHGIAAPLAGGPTAFLLFRHRGQVLPIGEVAVEVLAPFVTAQTDWAGLGAGPHVMGILNATPDSFSDGGDRFELRHAIAAGEAMLADGAALLDIGGESTRPGAPVVPSYIEQARILPLIRVLSRQGAVLSVDTRNASTMVAALDAGARIVNDVSALTHDPAAPALVAARGCPVVLMHMRGTPGTMKGLAEYDDVAGDVIAELSLARDAALAAGVARASIMLDPGFGFAKTAAQSIALLQRLPALLGLGHPLLAGISRKASIGALSGETDPKRRGPGSMAAALYAMDRGARILRVHDVAETVQAVRVWSGLGAIIPP